MSLASYTSAVVHSDDATFRVWGSQLSAALSSCGLVQTSDTGQINWASVVRAGVSADAGYEIYRLDDSWQSTKPVFFKFRYGTASSLTTPRLSIDIGTGSNGAGTLTGAISTGAAVSRLQAHGTSAVTRACWLPDLGLFWLGFNLGGCGLTPGSLTFFIERAKDEDGVVTADALYFGNTNASGSPAGAVYSYQTTAVSGTATSGVGCLVPGNITSSAVGTDVQVYRHYISAPRMRCSHLLTYMGPEFADFATIELTNYDGVARDYLPLGIYGGQPGWIGQLAGSNLLRLMVPLE